MNLRLQSLIQKLGEAIHESVAESPLIAGVVQEIRQQGFDVMLMLEATIGLNSIEEQPAGGSVEGEEGGEPFSAQDVSFLRSLRIAVEDGSGE